MRKNVNKKSAGPPFNLTVTLMISCVAAFASAAELNWPREIKTPEAEIVIYQPQLESFKSNKLTARAAVSVTEKGRTEPVFGVVWLEAAVATDRDNRMVTLYDIRVPHVKFPAAPSDKVRKLQAILEREIPKWDATISLDRLLTMLDLVEKEKAAAENLKVTPPRIIVVTYPSVLVTIDGQPQLQQIKNSSLMRVVNTPFFIVLEPRKKMYYLKGGDNWMIAKEIMGPWESEIRPPASVVSAAANAVESDQPQTQTARYDQVPRIVVATEPAELIALDGAPKYSPIFGTDLLYAANTESDVFMEIGSQQYYVLLAGRWFSADSLEQKQWDHVPGENLPADFAKIPVGSTKDYVLASVPGTQEATEAVLETYIPQTATVKRSEAKVLVVYDGEPKFVKIEDTDMYYAVNTSSSVIRYGYNFYCCHDAVWFVASSPNGPWAICVAVPQVIYTIPPSCPVYHVKYVYVYSYTPEVVYVGYTPGYVGCYVYGGTVVYGTGYYYHGWYHTHYYARPRTWGFAVRYNPHTGNWGFRVGYRSGGAWFVGGARHGGWWGAGGRRDIDIDVNRNINIDNSRNNIYNRRGGGAGRPRTDRTGARTLRTSSPGSRRPASAPKRSNNVFAGRDGSVNRRTDQGWQKRDGGGWSDRKGSTSQLDRQSSARQRGTDRTNHYNRSRSSTSRPSSRPSGRRGGRRR